MMMIPPTMESIIAKSERTGLTIKQATHVTIAIPMILKIASKLHHLFFYGI